MGVYCIESSRYAEIIEVAKGELLKLAEALAILFRSWDLNRAHIACKTEAINGLVELLSHAKFPKLAKPHVFVAYSARADETVRLLIGDTLEFQSMLTDRIKRMLLQG